MPDPEPLLNAVHRLADRFRSMPQSRLLPRAGEGLALAGRLAEAARKLESPHERPRTVPFTGAFAVGDQIAVTGNDLAAAIAARPAEDPEAVQALSEALRDVTATARRVGG